MLFVLVLLAQVNSQVQQKLYAHLKHYSGHNYADIVLYLQY